MSAAGLLSYLLRPRARAAADRRVVDELAWPAASGDLPAGLALEWLGTAGFRLAYQGHQILIDPYFTRLPLADVILRRPVAPARDRIDRYLRGPVDAVLVGHTHFDHAVDVPAIAAAHRCPVYGSRSLVNLMAMSGLAGQAIEVAPRQPYSIGPFTVTFVPSVHSRLVLGLAVPFDGDIAGGEPRDLAPSGYRAGQVFALRIEVGGVTFYHQGSADLIEAEIDRPGVDFFLCCISGRGFSPGYLGRILPRLAPRVLVPHHYDDFFRPLDAPFAFSPNIDLAGFVAEARAVAPAVELRALRPLAPVGG
jgi:L-ascorbate metabolism protein UlaG (beta-lactamase superfamily)